MIHKEMKDRNKRNGNTARKKYIFLKRELKVVSGKTNWG